MAEQDAIAVLKADHQKVRDLFAQYDSLGDRAIKGKADAVEQIRQELTLHAAIEEEIFYPRVRRAGREEKDEVLEAVEEHQIIKDLVAALDGMSADDESFDAKVSVLKEEVEHHVGEEEHEMFPHVRKVVGEDELLQLGQLLREAKAAGVPA